MSAHGVLFPLRAMLFAGLLALVSLSSRAEDPWLRAGAEGKPEVQLYFFWSQTCPHCTAAHPHIDAIPQVRPWVRLHSLELSGHPENVER